MSQKSILSKTIIFGLFLFTSCVTKKSPIITDTMCSPPCWQNIIPGQTSKTELEKSLLDFPQLESGKLFHRSNYHGYRMYYYGSLISSEDIVISLLDDTVSLIYFSGKDLQGLGITFEEAVKTFGEPEYIFSSVGPGYGKFFGILTGPYSFLYVSAIYPDKGIWFASGFPFRYNNPNSSDSNIKVGPETELDVIGFFDPHQYTILADKGQFSFQNLSLDDMTKEMYPWTGYGDLDMKYPYIP